jgi:hypothetical protein
MRREKEISGNKCERAKAAPIVRCRTIVFSVAVRVLETGEHVYSESGMAQVHALHEQKVRDDIARRLRTVCANFSDDDFEKLVKLMAARQVSCERRQSW